jgi:hypothetical protein
MLATLLLHLCYIFLFLFLWCRSEQTSKFLLDLQLSMVSNHDPVARNNTTSKHTSG